MSRHNSEILKIPVHLLNSHNSKVLEPIRNNPDKKTRDRPYEYFALKTDENRCDSSDIRAARTRNSLKRRAYVKGFSNPGAIDVAAS